MTSAARPPGDAADPAPAGPGTADRVTAGPAGSAPPTDPATRDDAAQAAAVDTPAVDAPVAAAATPQDASGTGTSVAPDAVRRPARVARPTEPVADQSVWLRFFDDGGRLTVMPAKLSRRLAVLDVISARFVPGVRYTEPEVNIELRALFDDYVSLRRELVDHGFLDRADGWYWRSGGSVDV
ncbi:DUF2087 domain-containing protein [Nakamurella endophytica]|uniref:DUF2087 domain-containing protein n=1 Tax=Nakamurella endophytica TaxID=1748367 RepID=A0A917WLD9_9ACTN|nr:DUF2087 domain-containing protein [Nakamurella endophytica]GGM12808.1 hypothetical protein GCM10011594_35910 [Nakamurella endophytica]